MTYSCSDFTDDVLAALEIAVPEEAREDPAAQAKLALAAIARLRTDRGDGRRGAAPLSDAGTGAPAKDAAACEAQPVRLVIDISGGLPHAVHADAPAAVIFVDYEDEANENACLPARGRTDKPRRVWAEYAAAEADGDIVREFFERLRFDE